MTDARVTQLGLQTVLSTDTTPRAFQAVGLIASGPPASHRVNDTQYRTLIAYSAGDKNVTVDVTQCMCMVAYRQGTPITTRKQSWTFIMDGHRFYVLPLGPNGDWAYDTTTKEWCQFSTQGFDGINFQNGVMWGPRVLGGDTLYPVLLELDPAQPFDDEWRPVKRTVTGGIATRGRYSIGVANFTITASVADDSDTGSPITLEMSDDNGVTYTDPMPMQLTDASNQLLIWNSLGSFSAPGRIFRVSDEGGPVRIDGADAVISTSDGADSGQAQEGQHPV